MGTDTTVINPYYSYTGQAPRQVRGDETYQAPAINLGGAQTKVENPTTGPANRYGRDGGEATFFKYGAPPQMMFTDPQKPLPVSPDVNGAAGLADQYPDPNYGGQYNPQSAHPAGATPPPGPSPTVVNPPPTYDYSGTQAPAKRVASQQAAPQRMFHPQASGGGNDWAAAAGGIASLGGAVMGSLNGADQALDAAKQGVDPGKADTSMRGRISDSVNRLFGGPSHDRIGAAYDASQAINRTGHAGPINVGGTPDLTVDPNAVDPSTLPPGQNAAQRISSMYVA